MATTKPISLVEQVARATEEDLAEIDRQITAKEQELTDAETRIGGELAALRALRRVIDVKLHGKPQRKQRQAKAAKSNGSHRDDEPDGFRLPSPKPSRVIATTEGSLASEIIGCINLNGPAFPGAIARKLDRTETGIKMAVSKSDRLKLLGDGRVALADHEED